MGAGALGGYFGGRLALAGEDVVFLARGAHLRAIQQDGLEVRSHHGDFRVKPAQATEQPSDVGPVDVVLFCVKSWDTESAARALRPMLGANTAVISLQNGVDNEDRLAETLGPEHIMGGLAYVTATIAAPGVIEQSSATARLIFGERDGARTARAEAFYEACRGAGIDAELSVDVEKEIWTKFLYICAFAGLTTLVRGPLGAVLHDPDARELFVAGMREAEAVARARGVQLEPDIVEQQLARADGFGAGLKASMLHDLERGNRLEVEWLNGAVARLGRELGVATPVNRCIAVALRPYAAGTGS